MRHIAADLARALDHLHENDRIHADLKPLNAVRVGGSWRLIDLDISCAVGRAFGTKVPTSGYCPPEMAKVLLDATDAATGDVRVAELQKYACASVAYDLWSFGVLLFELVFDHPLWLMDPAGGIAKLDDMEKLTNWDRRALNRAFKNARCADSADAVTAKALLCKLLEPDAAERLRHFEPGVEMSSVLKEPFFQADLSTETIDELAQQVRKVDEKLNVVDAKLNVVVTMGEKHSSELRRTRDVLMKSIFEATDVNTPTAFIVLAEELPPPPSTEQKKLLSIALNKDGFKIEGELAEHMEHAKRRFEEGMKWIDRLKKVGQGIVNADGRKIASTIESCLDGLVTDGKPMYFYLIDELTGEPVRDKPTSDGGIYPIKITKPSKMVPKLLPVMQVGVRAMSLYHGAAGIARMCGYPVPVLPEKWRSKAQSSVERLKQESSVEAFNVVHEQAMADGKKEQTVRGAAMRELQDFLAEYDKSRRYAGLGRIGDKDGAAVRARFELEPSSHGPTTRADGRMPALRCGRRSTTQNRSKQRSRNVLQSGGRRRSTTIN